MRCLVVLAFALVLVLPTMSFAEDAVALPTVALTQSELALHDEDVQTTAIASYMLQEARQRAKEVEMKIESAFRKTK